MASWSFYIKRIRATNLTAPLCANAPALITALTVALTVAFTMALTEGLTAGIAAQPAAADRLSQISARGRLLAEYDDACWKATDALAATSPARGARRFFARKVGNTWWVVFGRPSPDRRTFAVEYEATWAPGTQRAFGRKIDPPRMETNSDWLNYSRALDTVLPAYKPPTSGINYAILPAPNGYYVYFYPGSTEQGTYLLGGDNRYLVSRDLSKILEARTLHKSIIPYSAEPGKTIALGYHTAIMDNLPEDTDVFHVLQRRPAVPELVVTRDYVYKIFNNGTIKYMGTAADLESNKLNVED